MPIVIQKRQPEIKHEASARARIFDEMAKYGSSAGSEFNQDDEIERFYYVWIEAGRPRDTWVGYMVEGKDRVVRLMQSAAPEGAQNGG